MSKKRYYCRECLLKGKAVFLFEGIPFPHAGHIYCRSCKDWDTHICIEEEIDKSESKIKHLEGYINVMRKYKDIIYQSGE